MRKLLTLIFPFHNKKFCLPFFKRTLITNTLPTFSDKSDKCMDVFFIHVFLMNEEGDPSNGPPFEGLRMTEQLSMTTLAPRRVARPI